MGVRCFFALELPSQIVDVMGRCRTDIVAADPRWAGEKWVPPENLHVTLRFLPDVCRADLEHLVDAATVGIASASPVILQTERLVARPRPAGARMLWATVSDDRGRIAQVAEVLSQRTEQYGPPERTHAFTPHVTLCRARRARRIAPSVLDAADRCISDADLGIYGVSVPSVTLLESTLGPKGPTYRALARIPLGGV